MHESQLIIHYKNQIKGFREHFKQAAEHQEMENVHQLRLDIKKMRATLALMQFVSSEAFDLREYLNLFSKLFRRLGQVREAQINQELITKNDGAGESLLIAHFKQQQQLAEVALRQEMEAFDFLKLKRIHWSLLQTMRGISNQEVLKGAISHVFKKLMLVDAMKSQLDDPKKLHKARIQLKEVSEILGLINEIQKVPELEVIGIDIKTSTTMIGEWHDHRILLDTLEHIGDLNSLSASDQSLPRLVQQIRLQNTEMRENIKKKLLGILVPEKLKLIEDLH